MAGRDGGTPIETSLIARIATGVRFAFSGKSAEDFFGPGKPLAPAAQESALGRQFDYLAGYNIQTTPRAGEPVGFGQLRGLADAHDILRLTIETRKDQMAKLEFEIKPKDGKTQAGADAKMIQEFLERPDREHDWDDWLRIWLEELFVTDAATIYPRKTKGGELYALEPIDGALIKRVLSADGRTPIPPDPAYQQIIKGLPAVNYTAEELFYLPRNVRVNRIYGYSPVEQIIMTVNIALRRQVHQLQYYTEGNIPPMLVNVPQSWSTEQISVFQKYWDLLMGGPGNDKEKQRLRFVPGEMKAQLLQTEKLFDEGDEWLTRVICFAMSLSPTAFVKQTNRATAGTAQEVAIEEGLAPIMRYVARKMTWMIQTGFKRPDLGFFWRDQKDVDPLVAAQIDEIYVNAGVDTPDEVRERRGLEALPNGAGAEPKAPIAPVDPNADPGTPGGKPKSKKGSPDGVTAAAAEKYAALVDHAVAPNLAKKLAGLDMPDIEGGDVPLVNAALVPLSAALEIGKRESKTIKEE